MDSNKRFIEETFPVKEVSVESAREKNTRHGYISTFHTWWAIKPLASSRATNYASLVPAPNSIDEWNKKRQFIIEFSKWDNSLNQMMVEQARRDILQANEGNPPKVLDPFAGAGSIPLEALRIGCETYAGDLNPVAVLIQKCTLEYPQKYGQPRRIESGDWIKTEGMANPLLEDFKKWGNWVLEEAKREINMFYPEEEGGFIPVCYYWMRTITCQNPKCGADIPLTSNFWLAKKNKKGVALFPYVENEKLQLKVVGDGHAPMPHGFNPESGSISRAVATCLVCGSVVDGETTRKLFQTGKDGQKLVAVISYKSGTIGKRYRVATDKDVEIFRNAEAYLKQKRERLMLECGIDPVPNEDIPIVHTITQRPFAPRENYGIMTWGDLFNARQKLELITFSEKIRQAYKRMVEMSYDEDYAKVVVSYLALAIDRLADFGSTLCMLNSTGGRGVVHTFGRQILPMVFDYAESNPFFPEGAGWITACEKTIKWIEHTSHTSRLKANVTQFSATSLPYSDNFFDAVFTDPPYYDNVPYSHLSDFFYVWLKRIVGDLHPNLFTTPLTPKKNEIVAYSDGTRGFDKGKSLFESMLKQSFQEIHRVLKPDGIATIIYAHKSTEGWETLINSLLDSGLIVTSAWPISTEMRERIRAQESAALASTIYIIARKMKRQTTGFYNDVKEKLKQYLDQKLERLWEEGISGADFFIAAIGSAIVVFGEYEKVIDYEGNAVRAERLLDDVREIATDYAVRQILHDGFAGEITDMTRFYVLWRWNYGAAKVSFDEARKLAQSCGIDLANEWNRQRFIKKEKEFIRVLGPQERQLDELRNSAELIDVLHGALLLWEKSNRSEMVKLLQKSGHGKGEIFYRVAQAISETLPIESKEKKLLDGFLSGRERLREEIRKEVEQRRLL